jgi:hypothetical protein
MHSRIGTHVADRKQQILLHTNQPTALLTAGPSLALFHTRASLTHEQRSTILEGGPTR